MSRRSPRPLASALAPLQESLAPKTLLAEVQRVWPAAAGAAIAREATPVSERGGVVTIACAASVWAQELDLMAPELVAKLNAHLGEGRITALRCVAAPSRSWAARES
jgi:predicted nucleic acid-binding Zn ribbon protein